MINYVLSVLIGYACGCFLTAYFVAKRFAGKDISEIGTGNPGMANVMARLGKLPGFIVLIGDITKTLLAMGLANYMFAEGIGSKAMLLAGFGTLLGHNFPIWRKFKGGKGVAVTCAWIIIYMPFGGIVAAVAGGVITLMTGLLPLGAVLIALFAVPFAFVEYDLFSMVVMIISLIIMLYRNFPGFIRGFKNQEKREFKRESGLKNKVVTVVTIIAVIILLFVDYRYLI